VYMLCDHAHCSEQCQRLEFKALCTDGSPLRDALTGSCTSVIHGRKLFPGGSARHERADEVPPRASPQRHAQCQRAVQLKRVTSEDSIDSASLTVEALQQVLDWLSCLCLYEPVLAMFQTYQKKAGSSKPVYGERLLL